MFLHLKTLRFRRKWLRKLKPGFHRKLSESINDCIKFAIVNCILKFQLTNNRAERTEVIRKYKTLLVEMYIYSIIKSPFCLSISRSSLRIISFAWFFFIYSILITFRRKSPHKDIITNMSAVNYLAQTISIFEIKKIFTQYNFCHAKNLDKQKRKLQVLSRTPSLCWCIIYRQADALVPFYCTWYFFF